MRMRLFSTRSYQAPALNCPANCSIVYRISFSDGMSSEGSVARLEKCFSSPVVDEWISDKPWTWQFLLRSLAPREESVEADPSDNNFLLATDWHFDSLQNPGQGSLLRGRLTTSELGSLLRSYCIFRSPVLMFFLIIQNILTTKSWRSWSACEPCLDNRELKVMTCVSLTVSRKFGSG